MNACHHTKSRKAKSKNTIKGLRKLQNSQNIMTKSKNGRVSDKLHRYKGGTTIFGIADSTEGAQDIYYGNIGNIDSTAVNSLKEVVFQENEDVYYLTESAFAFSSSAMIPIGTAGKAGELTFRSGTVMLGKEGVSTLAGYGASNLVYDKTNNQTLGMIAGILASTGSAKGLNMADAKLGWSNKGVKGNVVESVTGNIETRVVVRLMY